VTVGARARALLSAVALVGLAGVAAPPGAASAPAPAVEHPTGAQVASVRLVSQTPTVPRRGTFQITVRTDGVPADALLELVVHGRVRSRSELAASMEGGALRTQVYRASTPMAVLPVDADGARRISLSLDPSVSGGVAITASGAYPVEVRVLDVNGTEITTLITHLLVEPDARDESPPLAVAVVAAIDGPPAIRPDGTATRLGVDVDDATEVVATLAAHEDVPATLALRPETLDELIAGTEPEQEALLDALPRAATGRSVLALPYVDVSPDALAQAGLASELEEQLEHGRELLADVLRVEPSGTTWLAGADLGPAGLAALGEAGVRHLVVDPDQVEPLRSGVLSLSLAQSFLIDADLDPPIDALSLDAQITDRLGTSATAGLEISRLLAELAVLWFEQPGIERGVALPVDLSVRPEVLDGLLAALDGGEIFEAVTLDDLFAAASPLRQPGGGVVDRALAPARIDPIDRTVARDLRDVRALVGSFERLIGPDSPRAEPVAAQLLLTTAAELDGDEQRAHLAAARAAVDAVVRAISAPNRDTITLTARDGTVPLTIRNDSGVPVDVVVRLHSAKLEFPSGDSLPVTLTDPTTRLDIDVRARASGSFPLEVVVTSPDGAILLTTIDFSVQSTAVSGVGVVLSAGAALFLLVWWARHWRRTRRSAKLVASTHPVARDVA
jgi:hypothetical protein